MRRSTIAWAGAGLLAAAALWWLQPDGPAASARGSGAGVQTGPSAHGRPAATDAVGGMGRQGSGASALGSTGADPLLTPGLRDAIEALLHAAGEAPDPETLKQRIAALANQHFAPELVTRALALAGRYVDYRVALGQLKPPADASDPRALRVAAEQRRTLRLRYFDGDEYDALFGQEQLLDDYTLARLEIERNNALDAAQKRRALADAEAQLPPALRTARAESVAHVATAQQTAAYDAQGVDDATRFAQRAATHGTEAAERLARLDQEERAWNARLDQYQQALHQGQEAARLQQLRHQLFSPEEQLRIDAALALRQNAGAR